MKNLLIAGAGDSGREILAWISTQTNDFKFKGFLDDAKKHEEDIIDTIDAYPPGRDDVFACGLAEPSAKMQVVAKLRKKGARFINLIHQSAILLTPLNTAEGLVIGPFVYVANQVKLENFVFANVAASIGHNVIIGEGSTISAHCDLTGYVVLGKRVFMGSHACIIPGKKVGDDAIIGAGSAVMRNVPAQVTVIGVPAKRLMG